MFGVIAVKQIAMLSPLCAAGPPGRILFL